MNLVFCSIDNIAITSLVIAWDFPKCQIKVYQNIFYKLRINTGKTQDHRKTLSVEIITIRNKKYFQKTFTFQRFPNKITAISAKKLQKTETGKF